MGIVIAAHVALWLWMIVPTAARPGVRRRRSPGAASVLQVELLASPPMPVAAVATATHRQALAPVARKPAAALPRARRSAAPRVVLLSAPATASSIAPAYIAGGDFDRRLRDSHLTPLPPKLPGGQRYLAANLRFVPLSHESVAAKVHAISDLIGFGWFDPVCPNARLELTRTRLQQIADGYTPGDLRRLLREHHCN